MSTQNDEIERRSRLVLLVYEVLRDMETPATGATNTAVLWALSQAFLHKATVLANADHGARFEVAAERRNLGMFSIAAE